MIGLYHEHKRLYCIHDIEYGGVHNKKFGLFLGEPQYSTNGVQKHSEMCDGIISYLSELDWTIYREIESSAPLDGNLS